MFCESKLAAVIVDYDTANDTLEAIEALAAGTVVPSVVVVVDNAQSGLRFEHTSVDVHVVRPQQNLGFAGGCNAGSVAAQELDCDVILFVNPDVLVSRDAVAKLCAEFDDATVTAVGGLIVHGGFYGAEFVGGESVLSLRTGRSYQRHGPLEADRVEVPFLHGAFFAVRTAAYLAVDGMDERFFLYREELDFFLRLRDSGGRVLLINDRVAAHVGGVATGAVDSRIRVSFMSRNFLLLARAHAGRWMPVWLLAWASLETGRVLVRKGARRAFWHVSAALSVNTAGAELAGRWNRSSV